ncbi:MAG: RNA polymerase sigma factor [Acidobacteriota bacterium]
MSQADLARLVAEARAGNPDAWGEVYRELAPQVFRLCRRVLPTREDAEDATGEIFLKVRLRLDRYDARRAFTPWLYRIAANHCWDELRKRRSRRSVECGEAEEDELKSQDPGPHELLEAKRSRKQIRAALGRVDDRARLALVLRYYAELSYQEIAEVLAVTPSFVGVLLWRARRELRRLLRREEL